MTAATSTGAGPGAPTQTHLTHLTRIRVEFGDCDPAGIVYFPNYYRWFDQATHALCEAAGYSLTSVRGRGEWVGYPIAECGARFRAPATIGDALSIETRIKAWHARFFDLEHRVWVDERQVAEGWQTRFIGFHDASRGGKLAALVIPEDFRTALSRLAGSG